jgi:hypothetical protein
MVWLIFYSNNKLLGLNEQPKYYLCIRKMQNAE